MKASMRCVPSHQTFFLCFCLYSQSQAVSDGGKHENPTFLRTQHVCAGNNLIQSRSVMLSALINGCVCAWMCFRVEHVCAGLWRQQLQSSRDSRRRGQPCQQCAELGRLIWEAVGGSPWSPTLYGETHSVLFFFCHFQQVQEYLKC